jgi:hypothetical protein
MKEPKLTKEGKLPQLHDVRARLYADDIMQLFLERLNNHTLSEVCKYIAGYFYRKQIASFNKIKEQADRIEKLEAALAKVAEGYETEWSTSSVTNMLDIAQILSERIVIAQKALEGKDDE